MVAKAQARIPVQAPTFTRLLARLAGEEVPAAGDGLTGVLDQWIDWNRAVPLARALDLRPSVAEPAPEPAVDPEEGEGQRQALALAILAERGLAATALDPASPDFAPWRQYYLSTQRAIQAASGRLRGSLRDQVAARSPELAQLAAVDAVMEQILSPREHTLLGRVVGVLEARFTRLQQEAAQAAEAGASDDTWLRVFRRELQEVLLGELDLRFQPIQALCEALRIPPNESR